MKVIPGLGETKGSYYTTDSIQLSLKRQCNVESPVLK